MLFWSAGCVKRLYCKRPILCLSSSKILTPPPPSLASLPGECVPPAFGAGGGHTRRVERGVGGQYFGRRETYSTVALYSTYVSTLRLKFAKLDLLESWIKFFIYSRNCEVLCFFQRRALGRALLIELRYSHIPILAD
jgi:hypothetical protein